jgi:hypothetical protein
LNSGDLSITSSTYACFDDDPQRNKIFTAIEAFLMDKQSMTVIRQTFTSGVSNDSPNMFTGPLSPFSSVGGLFATLPTQADVRLFTSHQSDVFEWGPDVLRMKTGFGKLSPGQVRGSYEFSMQRSTGHYTEQIVFDKGIEPDGFTLNFTGICIRIPNTQTPEEEYRSLK